ncbi:hypothetical protein H2248_012261 [Termitomyces sp. 'cryptogamus']|nr:hypothetical protein H2248_012261 [Termitomyces sp. 'cryptogamus']
MLEDNESVTKEEPMIVSVVVKESRLLIPLSDESRPGESFAFAMYPLILPCRYRENVIWGGNAESRETRDLRIGISCHPTIKSRLGPFGQCWRTKNSSRCQRCCLISGL